MMDIANYHNVAKKGGVCYSIEVYVCGTTRNKNPETISFLMYQIFVQTIFELQIAFNGIKFHIFASYTKDEYESIIHETKG